MSTERPHPQCAGSRRQFLWQAGAGFTGLALSGMLEADGFPLGRATASRPEAANPFAQRPPHRRVQAKSCIFLFMFGGPSQVDLFDYKPELQKRDGQSIDNEFRRNTKTKTVLQMNTGRIIQGHPSVGAWLSYGLGTPIGTCPPTS